MGAGGNIPGNRLFLEMLRKETRDVGALLIFDEVMTGFRVHPGGAQTLFDIKPDITAPGVNILAGASPLPYGNAVQGELFQSISGTSMSSPHVAGLGAVFLLMFGFALCVPIAVRRASAALAPVAQAAGGMPARIAVAGIADGLSRTAVAIFSRNLSGPSSAAARRRRISASPARWNASARSRMRFLSASTLNRLPPFLTLSFADFPHLSDSADGLQTV